jgi:bacterioferritin
LHSQTISDADAKNLELCIALNEMQHLEALGEMIVGLGGDLRYWSTGHSYWTGGNVSYGATDTEKISQDIFSETEAIAGYDALLREIQCLNTDNNPSLNQVGAVIRRIIEDENAHLTLFHEKFNQLKDMK